MMVHALILGPFFFLLRGMEIVMYPPGETLTRLFWRISDGRKASSNLVMLLCSRETIAAACASTVEVRLAAAASRPYIV